MLHPRPNLLIRLGSPAQVFRTSPRIFILSFISECSLLSHLSKSYVGASSKAPLTKFSSGYPVKINALRHCALKSLGYHLYYSTLICSYLRDVYSSLALIVGYWKYFLTYPYPLPLPTVLTSEGEAFPRGHNSINICWIKLLFRIL